MPRKGRNKSRNSKPINLTENIIMINEHPHDLNGTNNLQDSSSSSVSDIPKKRSAEISDLNDSNAVDVGPPRKKPNNQETKVTQSRTPIKRPLSNCEEESKNSKYQKIDDQYTKNFSTRIWKSFDQTAQNRLEDASHFVIVTYNVLDQQKTQQTNNYKSISVDNDCSNAECHSRLMEELDFINADILCLQQVRLTYWTEQLECTLTQKGFSGDISVDDKVSNIGIATLYRTERFVKIDIDCNRLSKLCLEQVQSINSGLDDATLNLVKQYLDEPDSYIVTVLKDKQDKNGRLLIVGNTHLSTASVEKQDLRCVQAVGMFWRIYNMISQINSDMINNNNNSSTVTSNNCNQTHFVGPCWILCGDFNSNPDSAVYQICRDGYPDERSISELQSIRTLSFGNAQESTSLVNLLWHCFQHPLTDSCSSYSKIVSYEPSGDYIWLSEDGLRPSKVLLPCSSEYLATNGSSSAAVVNNSSFHHLQHRLHQSDHISLACDVSFKT